MHSSNTGTNASSEFKGKRVLVTGGTKGAGKAIADRFLQGGGTVTITARSAPAEETAAHFIRADLSTSTGPAIVISEMLSRFKGVDIIVHNVGGSSAPRAGSSPSPTNSGSRPSTRTCIPPSGLIAACCRP